MPTAIRLPRGIKPSGPIMAERRFELTDRLGEYVLVRVRKPIKTYEGSLRWAGDKDGYLGFPKTYPEHLPKALLRKLEKMIEREISAHTRKLEAAHQRRQRQ
ncbi:hypothetical protein POL68_01265 [Stigmatella sp. ncwal1]|uniref:Uncharacterized protein n=1 Tax=Stigmatella ashevillensis TaxID=2995309 RepID=A0ABT5D2K5_9BACT|nr:hypothetical protein [Stigmatella ashevillena]MDC0707088.1 hypothetical protein [Stigmatella ashevillena]